MRVRFVVSGESGLGTTLDVEPSTTLEDVAAILEVELGIPNEMQKFTFSSRVLSERGKTIGEYGIHEGSSVNVATAPEPRSGAPAIHASTAARRRSNIQRGPIIDPEVYPSLSLEDIPGGVTGDELHAILQVNPGICEELRKQGDTEMLAAAHEATPVAMRTLLMRRNLNAALPTAQRQAKEQEMRRRLAADPMDAEAQRTLHDMITNDNVTANRDLAMEHMPEAFTRVDMLYVESKVNGTPLKIFVDCGAQTTIMSRRCAERVGLMRLVDTHFSGMAVGVGTARILGRVHMAPLQIGGRHFPCSFSVIDQDSTEFLLGLDFLRRYQCCIDLRANVLRLFADGTPTEVPFLASHEIPAGGLGQAPMDDGPGAAEAPPPAPVAPAPAASAGGGRPPLPSSSSVGASGGAGSSSTPPPGAAPRSSPALSADAVRGLFAPIDLGPLLGAGPRSRGGGRSAGIAAPAPPPASVSASAAPVSAVPPAASLAQPPAAPGATVPPSAAASPHAAAALATLLAMGYPRDRCEQALAAADGNVEVAAALLPDL